MTRSIINCVVISGRGGGETNAVFAFVHVKRREVGLDAVIKRTSTSIVLENHELICLSSYL